MQDLVNQIGNAFGIAPATMSFYLVLIMLGCRTIARAIPDTATGWLAKVRVVCSIIGMHVKDNTGVSAIEDETGAVVRRSEPESIPEPIKQIERPKSKLDEAVEAANAR